MGIRWAMSLALFFPVVVMSMNTEQSIVPIGRNQPQPRPRYLIPLEAAQKGLVALCQPLGYDRAARLDGNGNCERILQLIKNGEEHFAGLIIAPGGDNEKIINYFCQIRDLSLCSLPLWVLSSMKEDACANFLENVESFIERQNFTIVILNRLESLYAPTKCNNSIVRAIRSFMASHKQKNVAFLGICEDDAVVPHGLKPMFTSSRLMPAMNFAQRYALLQKLPFKFEYPQFLVEVANLLPMQVVQRPIRALYHAQEIGVLAQQTEGFSLSTLQGTCSALLEQHKRINQSMLDQLTRMVATKLHIKRTIGSLFSCRFFKDWFRPSFLLRSIAFSPEFALSHSPEDLKNMLLLSNTAQYGHREPSWKELIKDYAPHVGILLLRIACKWFSMK